ncbi:MAG: beta-N-acetylhexosaminidase [Candidatus Binatia bacterium]|nr:MAG: beta-N-acetylhexosaminidase [Candidatus Binatia bacterium]
MNGTGSLLTVGIPGPRLDSATREFLDRIRPGVVILFRRNVEAGLDALRRLIADLHDLPWHPLVAIDHEGGRVMRLDEPFTRFPPAAVVGARRDQALARDVAFAMGRELASVGFDLVYAPVLDVLTRTDNAVIADRALGSAPHWVARLGAAQVRGFWDAGILCCGKHFPGHGDTAVDSHYDLPHVEAGFAELERRELVPFRAAIEVGVPMLMTAHVVYSASSGGLPATLDPLFLRTVLREKLRFGGVVVTDDLEMGAVQRIRSPSEAAVEAVEAGADGVLVCQTSTAALAVALALEKAAEERPHMREAVETACRRWLAVREKLAALPRSSCELPCAEHRRLAQSIASRS